MSTVVLPWDQNQGECRTSRLELVAPAGGPEAMRAAVENGADGVYFGIDEFNARLRADNFRLEDLPELASWLHERGVRAYLTLNTLVFPEELERVAHVLLAAAEAGIDAVMVQDLGVAYLARHLVPELPVHASTQMTLTSPESYRAVEALGLRLERIVAPRELEVGQLARLVREVDAEVEVFVHGALCVAYSGQCLTSEALGGRSANRGECAQACRLPYELIVDGRPKDLGEVRYLLSPRDLAAYEDLPALAAAGVRSLKIEGRLKSPTYVAATVQVYRRALEALENRMRAPLALDPDSRYRLEMAFSRGFTGGYLHRIDHQAVVEGRYPKKRGPYLGRVQHVTATGVVVALEAPLALGDGIVFDAGHPEREEMGGRVYALYVGRDKVERIGRDSAFPLTVTIRLARERFDPRSVHVGDRVWKTSDPRLEQELARTYRTPNIHWRRPVYAHFRAVVGEQPRLTLTDTWGLSVTVFDDFPVQIARESPLDRPTVEQHLGRLGNSPLQLAHLELEMSANAFVPASRLNGLRRKAVQALLDARRQVGRNRHNDPCALQRFRSEIADAAAKTQPSASWQLAVLCRTLEQVAMAVTHPDVWIVYTDFENLRWHAQAGETIRRAGKRFVPATLRIMKPREHGFLRVLLEAQPDAILVRHLAAWHLLRQWAPPLPIIGDYALNVANELTADLLMKAGFEALTPSYDLNGEQLLDLLERVPPSWFEVTIHQHMPMFHMEHCVFCRFLSNGHDDRDCGRPCEAHRVAVRDRMGYEHPIKADAGCRNTVYNAVAQSAAEYVPHLMSVGVRRFRIEFIEEDNVRTRDAIETYAALLRGTMLPADVWRRLKAISKLGVTRGSLDHA